MKIEKNAEGTDYKETVLLSVRYGELILPSKAEEAAAVFENHRKRARTIRVSPSTYEKDQEVFKGALAEAAELVTGGFAQPTNTTDVVFRLGGEVFHAHRAVVGQRCDHFGALFHSGMRDACELEIEVIPACDPQAFRDFLRHLYLDEAVITPDNVVELLELAAFYQVKRLLAQCELSISEGIDLDSACDLLEIADRHSALQLERFCESYVIDHYPKVSATEGFKKMPRELMQEVLAAACHQLALATATHHKQSE